MHSNSCAGKLQNEIIFAALSHIPLQVLKPWLKGLFLDL